jgi:hypothetical protein
MYVRREKTRRSALDTIRNNKAAWFTSTVAIAATAVFLFAQRCGPMEEGPMPVTPTKGDRVCNEVEAYPYALNANGTIQMDEENKPVPNPHYSKEDCHKGDNVCDNNAQEVKDPEGNKVALMNAFTDGTAVARPLEDEHSPDCIMQAVKDSPCAEFAEDRSNVIPAETRTRVTEETELGLRQRSRAEVEAMHADATAVQLGDNYFVVENAYNESCDANLPMCTPETTEACYCPNLEECVPDNCGNGTIEKDKGEQCDPGSPTGRRACKGGKKCAGNCQCVSTRVCGNGKLDREEECDPASLETRRACRDDTTCSNSCKCQSACGNGRIDSDKGEECDPKYPMRTCDDGESCNSRCECESAGPVQCEGNSVPGSGDLISAISSQVTSSSGVLKNSLGATRVPVRVRVRVNISVSGSPSIAGASATCDGSKCPQQADIVGIAGLNTAGITTGIPERPCFVTIPVGLR